MDLTIDSQRMGQWTILQVSGELDLHTSSALRDSVFELLEAGASRLAIDVEHVGFMDSSSLGILVMALKRIRENGGDLALVGVNGSPLRVLALTGIDRLMPTYGSTADLPAD